MTATELTHSLKDLVSMKRVEGLTQKEIAKRVGEPQQMVSRLLFLAKAGDETLMMIRRQSMSKTALSKLIDLSRMKAKGRTLRTKLLMLKKLVQEFGEDKTIKERKSQMEKKLDRNRLRLVQLTGDNFMLREGKNELARENDALREEVVKAKFDLSLYQLSLKKGERVVKKVERKVLTPDQMYQIEVVKSALGGVKVSVDGPRVLLDCMTEEYRDTTLERLCSVRT